MARYHVHYAPTHHVALDDGACTDDECVYQHAFVYLDTRGAYLDVEHDDGTVDHWHAFPIDDREPRPQYLDLVGDVTDDVGGGGSAADGAVPGG